MNAIKPGTKTRLRILFSVLLCAIIIGTTPRVMREFYYRDSREGRKGAYPPLAHGARLPFFGCLSLFAPPDQINMLNTPA